MLWLPLVAFSIKLKRINMFEPSILYLFIRNHIFQIVATLLAVIGFALRLRGLRRPSTMIILVVYFIIYVLPALMRRF